MLLIRPVYRSPLTARCSSGSRQFQISFYLTGSVRGGGKVPSPTCAQAIAYPWMMFMPGNNRMLILLAATFSDLDCIVYLRPRFVDLSPLQNHSFLFKDLDLLICVHLPLCMQSYHGW